MRRAFILILLIAGITPAFGQDLSGRDYGLNLEECIKLALKNRIELRIASKDIENSKEQIKEAKSFYYPRLNLNAGYTHFNKPLPIDVDIDIRSAAAPYNNAIGYINSITLVQDRF